MTMIAVASGRVEAVGCDVMLDWAAVVADESAVFWQPMHRPGKATVSKP